MLAVRAVTPAEIERFARMAALQEKAQTAILPLAEPGIGLVVVIAEVSRPGRTFKGIVSMNVAEHSVPELLRSAREVALEQLEQQRGTPQ